MKEVILSIDENKKNWNRSAVVELRPRLFRFIYAKLQNSPTEQWPIIMIGRGACRFIFDD